MTETTLRQPLKDGRHFRLKENEAHVWRVVDPSTSEPKGVQLTIAFGLHATSPCKFFTDDGKTFWSATFDADGGCLKVTKKEIETDAEKLEPLKKAFAIWHAASGHSDRRKVIRKQCEDLRTLLNSLSPQTSVLHHLQVVTSIQAKSQTAPDKEIQGVEDDLNDLLLVLRYAQAADGQMMINQERFEQFLADVTCD